jgi:hypothetical protein
MPDLEQRKRQEAEIVKSLGQLTDEQRAAINSKEKLWVVKEKHFNEFNSLNMRGVTTESPKRQFEKAQMGKDGFKSRKAWKKHLKKKAIQENLT